MPLILNGDGSVGPLSATEIGYLDGVTSAVQTQINTKAPSANPTFTGNVTGVDIPYGTRVRSVFGTSTFNANNVANTFVTIGPNIITTNKTHYIEVRLLYGAGSYSSNSELWVGTVRVHDEAGSTWDSATFTAASRNDGGSKQGSCIDFGLGTLTGTFNARSVGNQAYLNLNFAVQGSGGCVSSPWPTTMTYMVTVFMQDTSY